nr:hypothetical protein [Gluconobacter morbifer]
MMQRYGKSGLYALLLAAALAPLAAQAQGYQGYPSQTQVDGQPGTQSYPAQQPQQQQQLSPQARADIERAMHYTLPPDFMPRAAATLSALQASNIQPPNSQGATLEQTIARVGQVPGLTPILQQHGFTPATFVMGVTAFGMTLAASNGQQLPQGMPSPNPANVALFKAHPDQVSALMQAMGSPPH